MTRRARLTAALAAALVTAPGVAATRAQTPAPYQLFVATDGEMKSDYSADLKATIVQLALRPPGTRGTPPPATLVFYARYPGREPEGPPPEIRILALPTVLFNPNVVRGVQMQLTIEHHKTRPLTLSYFGESWGDYGYVGAGGEITRVAFTMSPAELRALGFGEQVTGEVLNADFVFTADQLAALERFAIAVGIENATNVR